MCPSEVRVSTAPPSLEVCSACPPCWPPPRLPPPHSHSLGSLIQPFHKNTGLMLEVQIVIYTDYFPLWHSKSCWQACTALVPAAFLRKANSSSNQSWDLEQRRWCELWAEQELTSDSSFWECCGCRWVGWGKCFETAWNSCWLKSHCLNAFPRAKYDLLNFKMLPHAWCSFGSSLGAQADCCRPWGFCGLSDNGRQQRPEIFLVLFPSYLIVRNAPQFVLCLQERGSSVCPLQGHVYLLITSN